MSEGFLTTFPPIVPGFGFGFQHTGGPVGEEVYRCQTWGGTSVTMKRMLESNTTYPSCSVEQCQGNQKGPVN